MAYENYSGRCIGTIMKYLYPWNYRSNYWEFDAGQIIKNGTVLGAYSWLSGTDVPIFNFYDKEFRESWADHLVAKKRYPMNYTRHKIKLIQANTKQFKNQEAFFPNKPWWNKGICYKYLPRIWPLSGTKLGYIKKRSDGRVGWWTYKIYPALSNQNRQGVAKTEQDAKDAVEAYSNETINEYVGPNYKKAKV